MISLEQGEKEFLFIHGEILRRENFTFIIFLAEEGSIRG